MWGGVCTVPDSPSAPETVWGGVCTVPDSPSTGDSTAAVWEEDQSGRDSWERRERRLLGDEEAALEREDGAFPLVECGGSKKGGRFFFFTGTREGNFTLTATRMRFTLW